ncbi:DNA topoisomerase 3 [Candidatus Xiphinematobacter sp. Idaho Grape]|uniref:DNA topoisomerase III n=1 Tax=Candidatus Xiphinematobacter sp. Idaho Grape TaxID=1704307 RepID=UPI0007065C0A|nr:DNA topoisomerase III [Candidatus Xiphinematobacter sp. Idaho Grape]ALJ56405.1 DNA topoisomerase 3 [Candidatus Xiphinematobacter sp. Idaho Grape]
MGKSLVIAEKPSVATSLARVLGKLSKKGDYFENEQYVITSAIGHLVELCLPNETDKKNRKWDFSNLPIIPSSFGLKPIKKTVGRFQLICKLLHRQDVVEVINACDAGREGELVFRYLMRLAKNHKPTRRLWLQSMTGEAIRAGFQNLRREKDVFPLGEAAICRSEGDWLVGINGTRAMTVFNSGSGRFRLTPVGRVQTPTLSILVEREEKIHSFTPRAYFEILANFSCKEEEYWGRWFDPLFQRGGDEDDRAERLWDRKKAEAIQAKCQGGQGIAVEEKKESSQSAPLLYDLTSLQKEANIRHSLSARRTLQIVQTLYERHKALTYPRTDSRYLPEDYLPVVRSALESIKEGKLHVYAKKALAQDWVKPIKRVFDNAKVTDHHAIIPTGVTPRNLDEMETRVYDMIRRRLVAAFYPAAQFQLTTRTTTVEGESFQSEGKTPIDLGWLSVYGKQLPSQEVLAPIHAGTLLATKMEVVEHQTKPPARYSEATLLSAMEGAGKLLEEEALREAMHQRGLGTPATRAQIIEGLVTDGYVTRQGRRLIATAKGIMLMTLLRDIGIQDLCFPELTGEWEYKLKRIEADQFDRDAFMGEIRRFAEKIVEKTRRFFELSSKKNCQDLEARCPKCHATSFSESFHTYECKSCGLLFWKNVAGRQFTPEEIRGLLETGSIGPLEGFRSKNGNSFVAKIKLDNAFKVSFDFGDSYSEMERKQAILSSTSIVGSCPVCHEGKVYDTGFSYCCNRMLAKECTLNIGKVILQKEIPQDQMIKVLQTGKTDLISQFVSRKGRRFSAYLILKNGKVKFEFLERQRDA